MPISDKTRKVLWGRSGNRCAICRRELLVERTQADDQSVVGDECHIVSGQPQGPRSVTAFPADQLDAPENLILLCRVHHKMVDDQHETYTVELLRLMKANHEKWVATALSESEGTPPIRLRRIKENIPTYLARLRSGRDIMNAVQGALSGLLDHDELKSEAEVTLVGGFLQEVSDWLDLADELEAGDRVRAAFGLNRSLEEVEQAGFMVFGGREVQRIEGGVGAPSDWPLAIIRVVRASNPEIIVAKPGAPSG